MFERTAAATGEEYPSARYVTPFVLFLVLLAVSPALPIDPEWETAFQVVVLAGVCWICWPREIGVWPSRWLASMAVGASVFVLWIAPDLLIPGYRNVALFSNAVVGHAHSSLPPAALHNAWMLGWRTARAVLIVPIVEELFWRAWLMRWLINSDFQKVALGAYTTLSFWLTGILFASEHGPYWDVGLLSGMIYNLWMIRSKSVADCVIMHAVTNGLLSAYVIAAGQWQYWQ